MSNFRDGGHRVGNLLPGSDLDDDICLRKRKSIRMQNLDEISQSNMAAGRHLGILEFYFRFRF